MRNRMYGGVRGRKTKVGRKLLRFPPTRLHNILIFMAQRYLKFSILTNKILKSYKINSQFCEEVDDIIGCFSFLCIKRGIYVGSFVESS